MRETLTMKDRGQMSANRAVQLVVILAVFGIVGSVLAPVALDALVEDDSTSFTNVSESDTVEVKEGILNATLDDVNDASSQINVTLTDVDSGNTVTATNVSGSQEVTLEGETLTVTLDNKDSNTQADFTVSYPADYGWSGGATSLWGILDLAIVLVIFLFAIGLAMAARSRM